MSVYLSVPTLDEGAWRETEPHTPSPRARLDAVAELNRAGVPAGVLIAPLMPGINDSPKEVRKIVELAREAGAISTAGVALHLRGELKQIFFKWLRMHRPDLVSYYEELYSRGAYVPAEVGKRITEPARTKRRAQRRGTKVSKQRDGAGEAGPQRALF
jgi:DNA repair photolyase